MAGGILAIAGAFLVVTGLQALGFEMRGLLNLVPPMALLLGAVDVALAAGVARARLGAARVALVLASITCLFALCWSGFALLNGVLSLIAVSVVPISGVAILLVLGALKDIRTIDAARARLRVQGLDTGL